MPADPLALAVTQLPGWRWLPGMRLIDTAGLPALVLYLHPKGGGVVADARTPYKADPVSAQFMQRALPDLDDEATGGCLLAALDEAWEARCPGGWVEVAHRPGRARVTLRNAAGQASTLAGCADYYDTTPGRACAAALVAIGRCA